MNKYFFVLVSLIGLLILQYRFPCHWVNPKRCSSNDLPKEPPPYFPRHN